MDPNRRILVLNGGGVRVLSEILIRKNIMQRIAFQEKALKRPKGETCPEPWKYFDLICGTSTGGLLAIMLGRLRMNPSKRQP
jgi:patatin-like phospholipase/acyl hydrolase